MTEWRDIPGFEGRYQVSNEGQVMSLRSGKILVGGVYNGRQRVQLYRGDSSYWEVFIHRLVCIVFNGPPPEGKSWALHRNGNARDNRPENLYWGDARDNNTDMMNHGTHYAHNKHKTVCPKGHEYTEENTYRRKTGHRECRTCRSRPGYGKKRADRSEEKEQA